MTTPGHPSVWWTTPSTRMDPAYLKDSTRWCETSKMDLSKGSCPAASIHQDREPAETGDHEGLGQARGRPGVAYEYGERPSTVYEGGLPQASGQNDEEGALGSGFGRNDVLLPTTRSGEHLAPSGLWNRPRRGGTAA